MSLTTRVLVGLIAGFLVGLALTNVAAPVAAGVIAVVTPIGAIFVNLIRMTVIPLVVSMLIASVGATGASAALGRTGARAALLAILLLLVTAALTVLLAEPLLARVAIDQAAALALRGPTAPSTAASPRLSQWFVDLVPQN